MNPTTETAVVKAPSKAVAKKTIKELIHGDEFKLAVKQALPVHLKAERFVRVVLNATMRNPELLECTKESFFKACMDLSSYGIEPDGRRAHLIPFRNNKTGTKEVQLIIDYKGLAELVRRSGDVSYIHADVVYEGDTFDFAYGSDAHLRHVPASDNQGAKMQWAYSFVKLKDGCEDFIVLRAGEIEAVRKRSRASASGPWVSDYPEMAKKTAFRRHSKWLPLSSEARDAVEADDDAIELSPIREVAQVSIDDIRPSDAANRGHDETGLEEVRSLPDSSEIKVAEIEKATGIKPVTEDRPFTDAENRALDLQLAEEENKQRRTR